MKEAPNASLESAPEKERLHLRDVTGREHIYKGYSVNNGTIYDEKLSLDDLSQLVQDNDVIIITDQDHRVICSHIVEVWAVPVLSPVEWYNSLSKDMQALENL